MAAPDEAPDHVSAHPAQSDHRELHDIHLRWDWSADRSRSMAAATLSRSLKIADPATSTSAPAATASGAVVASIPPSTSRTHTRFLRSINSRARLILSSVAEMNG